MQNLSRTRGNNRNLHYFCPAAKILPTKRPPLWGPFLDTKTGAKSPGHKQIKLRLNEWTPFWGPFLDPKTGFVLSAKLLSPSEKQHKFRLFLHVRDRSFPYRWLSRALQRREYLFSTPCEHLCPHMFLNSSRACADIHACRAWRTIARGAAKSWKPSGMQNLSRTRGNNRNLHYFCPAAKILPTKRPPFWGPFLDTKTGAKSPGHKQIKLRLNGLHFGVRFWTPKRGSFCRQNCCHRAKNSTSFDCFFMYATEVSHTAGFPGLCSAASTCSPHPANIYVHTCS